MENIIKASLSNRYCLTYTQPPTKLAQLAGESLQIMGLIAAFIK